MNCEDCGCKMYDGRCTNCHEELFILDQYLEQEMELPSEDSEFMKRVEKQTKQVEQNEIYRKANLAEQLEAKERNRQRWQIIINKTS